MKRALFPISTLLLAVFLLFSVSCKKDRLETPASDDTQEQSDNATDDAEVEAESDEALEDADNALGGSSSFNKTAGFSVCGATKTVDTTTKTITITYDGTTRCKGRTRSGQIKLQLTNGVRWRDTGATVTLTFINYKITNGHTGYTLTLNGYKARTNVNGGTIPVLLLPGQELKHKIRASLVLTFNNGTTQTWGVARTRTVSKTGLLTYSITITGDTTINSIPNIATWGKNRKGYEFYTQISVPVQANNICGWWRPTDGIKTHKGKKELTVTFNVDSAGNRLTTGCPARFMLNWTNSQGVAKRVIKRY